MIIDQPLLVASKDQDAQQLATSAYRNQQQRKTGPLYVIGSKHYTALIDEHGIENTAYSSRIEHAPAM